MSEDREKFVDKVLDQALANYGQAEPRLGLEGRVLARLEVETKSPARVWWKWSWAPAAAALLIAGGLYISRPKLPATPGVAEKPAPPVTTTAKSAPPPVVTTTAQAKVHVRPSPRTAPTVVTAAAKQPQFPAAARLSEQDRLLLAFVRLHPQAAAQQAQAAARPPAEIKIDPLEIPPLRPDGDQQAPQR